jgi:hypothetical protein
MKINRYQAVEIIVQTGSTVTQYNFPDLPNLRDAKIQAIELIGPEQLTKSPISGNAMISNADLAVSSLVLYQGDVQITYYLSLTSLNRTVSKSGFGTPYVYELFEFNNTPAISWTKSFVNMNSAPTSVGAAPAAFVFGVYYSI